MKKTEFDKAMSDAIERELPRATKIAIHDLVQKLARFGSVGEDCAKAAELVHAVLSSVLSHGLALTFHPDTSKRRTFAESVPTFREGLDELDSLVGFMLDRIEPLVAKLREDVFPLVDKILPADIMPLAIVKLSELERGLLDDETIAALRRAGFVIAADGTVTRADAE